MRVAENLNHALHACFDDDADLHLLGEDVTDPYGGAFKITRGLSARHPTRVLSTPISEAGLVGAAAGLALTGNRVIAEVMFGDFMTLCFDQIVNFAAKSVTMYGRPLPIPLVVRCPVGGSRGYGPTHSQSPQKHFLGVPNLALFELSPFHDNTTVLRHLLGRGHPCLFFEDKVLYTQQMCQGGRVDDLLSFDVVGPDPGIARVFAEDPDDATVVVIAPGGVASRVAAAMRRALLEEEISTVLLVPSQLYPLDVDSLLPLFGAARRVLVAEESVAGGTWGSEVAHQVHQRLWRELSGPVRLVHSADSVIPTAGHLESRVLIQVATIHEAIREAARA